MDDYGKLIYGEALYRKVKKFEEGLLVVEEKHIEFFKNRESQRLYEEHDRLHNHCSTIFFNNKITFGFEKDSDLPFYVRRECADLFKSTVIDEDNPDSM